MKAMKYLFMAALMTGFSSAATAQDGSKADVDAVKQIVSSKPADLDKQLKPFFNKNKKNVENLVAFGRVFYEARDTARARVYANQALTVSKYKCAPAFILLGDIEALGDDTNAGGRAAEQYDQAIMADPKNPDGYYKYALVNRKLAPQLAVQRLDELKQQRPDVEVNAIKGHIFAISNKDNDAYEAYSKAAIDKLDRGNLSEYASCSFFSGHHAEGMKVVEYAITRFPRYATFNRLGMMFGVELKEYDKAIAFADRFFNASDSVLTNHNHEYYYQGLAYDGKKDYDKAIELYKKALTIKSEGNLIAEDKVIKSISDAYKSKGDFDNAAQYLRDYVAKKDKATFSDHESIAKLFLLQASDTTITKEAKEAALGKADAVYEELAKTSGDNELYVLYQRANIGMQLDPELQSGAAKPFYEKIIEVIEQKPNREDSDTPILRTAYHYMMSRSLLIDKNKPLAKEYAAKILAIDPNYKAAQAVSDLK